MKNSATKSMKSRAKNKAADRVPNVPYFTRDLLIRASKLGLKWDYNRQLSERIAEVPNLKYQVIFHMPHYHRHFERCEEHIRCMISLAPFKDVVVFCDVPVEFFKKLPNLFTSRQAA